MAGDEDDASSLDIIPPSPISLFLVFDINSCVLHFYEMFLRMFVYCVRITVSVLKK